MTEHPDHSKRSAADAPVKRPYVRPELVEYGTVAKLTQTGGMTSTDFFAGLRRMGME